MSIPVLIRRARKPHPCGDYRCDATIQPGELYERWVEEPYGEVWTTEGWKTLLVCTTCAANCGRDLDAIKSKSAPEES